MSDKKDQIDLIHIWNNEGMNLYFVTEDKVAMVVHCKKDKYDVLIDRSTIFGNPFRIGKDGNRKEVIVKFRKWMHKESPYENVMVERRQRILQNLMKLKDKVMG